MATNAPSRMRSRALTGGLALAITTTVAACAPGTVNVYKNIQNPLSYHQSKQFAFDEINIWQDGAYLSIAGRVEPRHFGLANGHVDVAIRGASGQVYRLLAIRVRDRYYKGRWRGAFFNAKVLFSVPADARINLALHDPKVNANPDSGLVTCPRNLALAPGKDVEHAR